MSLKDFCHRIDKLVDMYTSDKNNTNDCEYMCNLYTGSLTDEDKQKIKNKYGSLLKFGIEMEKKMRGI